MKMRTPVKYCRCCGKASFDVSSRAFKFVAFNSAQTLTPPYSIVCYYEYGILVDYAEGLETLRYMPRDDLVLILRLFRTLIWLLQTAFTLVFHAYIAPEVLN